MQGLNSFAPLLSLLPLVGVFLALDRFTRSKERVRDSYRLLRDQVLFHRCRATKLFVDGLNTIGEYEFHPGGYPVFVREFWERLYEIQEKEAELNHRWKRYSVWRKILESLLVLGILASLASLFLPWFQTPLFYFSLGTLFGAIILVFSVRSLVEALNSLGEHAIFRYTQGS